MKKKIVTIFTTLILVLCLASCGGNAAYKDYKDTLSPISKDNPFEKISKNDFVAILEEQKNNSVDNEILYLFYGDPDIPKSGSVLQIFEEQAKQYSIELIYYINSSKVDTSKEKEEYKADLQMRNPESVPSFLIYVDGELDFDGSRESVMEGPSINNSYTNVAYYAFIKLPNSLK